MVAGSGWKVTEVESTALKYNEREIVGIITILIGLASVLSGLALVSGLSGNQSIIIGLLIIYSTLPEGASPIVFGLFAIGFGLLIAFVGYKFYKGFRWAYNAYVIIALITFLMSFTLKSPLGLFVSIGLLLYLYAIRVRKWEHR